MTKALPKHCQHICIFCNYKSLLRHPSSLRGVKIFTHRLAPGPLRSCSEARKILGGTRVAQQRLHRTAPGACRLRGTGAQPRFGRGGFRDPDLLRTSLRSSYATGKEILDSSTSTIVLEFFFPDKLLPSQTSSPTQKNGHLLEQDHVSLLDSARRREGRSETRRREIGGEGGG